MIGIPIELYASFPSEALVILLTESAKSDPNVIASVKAQLEAGKTVVITSGLLHALEAKASKTWWNCGRRECRSR